MEGTAEQQEPSSGLEGADPPDRSAGRETGSIPSVEEAKASLGREVHAAEKGLEAGVGTNPHAGLKRRELLILQNARTGKIGRNAEVLN